MSCSFFLFSFLLVFHIPIDIKIVFAQQEKQQGFLTWTDPKGKFSINHPYDWKVEEEGNRFGTYEVTFADPTNSSHVSIYLDEKRDNIGMEGSQDLRLWFEIFTSGFGSSVPGYKELGSLDYEKYMINGQQTGSVIFTGINNTEGLLAGTQIDGERTFLIAFVTKQTNFDRLLPKVEDMINSVKILS